MLVLVILIWLVSPFAELAVIFILLGKNREYKKKIGDLEQLLYGRQRQQPGSSGVWANGQMPVRPPMGPGAPVNGPAPMQRPGMAASAVQINGQPPMQPQGAAMSATPVNGQMPMQQRPVMSAAPMNGQIPMQPQGPVWQHQQPRPAAAAVNQKKEAGVLHANTMGTLALIVGIVFVVLAGLIFATTTWKVLPDFCKVLLVGFFAVVLFGASFVAEKKLHIHKTGNGLYILGSIFLFLTVLAACYFRFLGPAFVLEGTNRYLVLWLGSLVTVGVWFTGLGRFHDRIFTQACLWGTTVSMMFLTAAFVLDFHEFSGAMTLYAFCLLLLEWSLDLRKNQKQKAAFAEQTDRDERESETSTKKEPPDIGLQRKKAAWGEAGRMLLREMALFVPVHFWGFAVLCANFGIFEILYGDCGVLTLIALSAALAGTGVMCFRKKSSVYQWIFALSLEYFLHYMLIGWLFAGSEDEIYALLTAEAVSVLWFFVRTKWKKYLLAEENVTSAVCSAGGCMDGMAIASWIYFVDVTGAAAAREWLAAFGAAVLLVLLLYSWSRRYPPVRHLNSLVCLYLTVTVYKLMQFWTPHCPEYQVFALCYVCFLLLWNFRKQQDCLISVILVSLIVLLDFPLSAVPVLLLAGLAAAGKRRGRAMPRQDFMLAFLYVLSSLGFYGGLRSEFWTLFCFLFMSLAVYVLFYRGNYLWLCAIPAVAMLPVPLVLMSRYQLSQDELYGFVAGALLAGGLVARCMVPIIRKREEEGGWNIDFYHVLSVVVLFSMALWTDDPYWRFAYVLLHALYCAQYITVKGFDGCDKVRRAAVTAGALCLLPAFWLQPFVTWPEVLALEINLLPVAVFLWALVFFWGKSQAIQDVRTVGYAICLVILTLDDIFSGRAEDVLLLEGICLAIFVWARVKDSVRWQYLSLLIMFGAAAGDFYIGSCLGVWGIGLLLVTFWLSYPVFYGGACAGLCFHLFTSLVMLPMPYIISSQYEITGGRLYGMVAVYLLGTGIAARYFAPVVNVKQKEGEAACWRIDFYHMVCVIPIMALAFWADPYWRFAYLLLLGLYSLQYRTVKGFEGFEKVRRASLVAAVFWLLPAFWLQPFIIWPEVILLEVNLLPTAVFLWLLGRMWGKSNTMWNIQTAGYVLLLVFLSLDGVRTGRVEDALMLGGVCLLAFVWALVKSSVRWVRIAGAWIVVEALYMTKDFWFSLSWWIYLLAAGIGLLLFAAVSEKKKK